MKDSLTIKKVKVGNAQKKAQSERNSHSKNRGGEKNDIYVLILRKHFVSRVSSYFPIGGQSDLNTNMKTYIRFKQHKIRLQNIKQIQPQRKYSIGTISS